MSKKFFLLLVLTIAANSNQIFAAEICDITDTIQKDLIQNKVTMLGGMFNSLSNFAGFGQKEQTTITNKSISESSNHVTQNGALKKNAGTAVTVDTTQKVTVTSGEMTDWCGTKVEQIRNRAKTLFGISFDKKELMYFGASAIALITIGGIVYVIKNKDKNNWTFEKVSQDMQKFVGEHKTAIKSSIITAVIVGIIALYAKRQGISFESVSSWTMNRFVKQSTSTHQVSVLK